MSLAFDACPKASDLRESEGGIRGEARRSVCNAVRERAQVDENYFMGRMHASVARAEHSAESIAKLVHYELAGRYSVAALAAGQKRSLDCCRQ